MNAVKELSGAKDASLDYGLDIYDFSDNPWGEETTDSLLVKFRMQRATRNRPASERSQRQAKRGIKDVGKTSGNDAAPSYVGGKNVVRSRSASNASSTKSNSNRDSSADSVQKDASATPSGSGGTGERKRASFSSKIAAADFEEGSAKPRPRGRPRKVVKQIQRNREVHRDESESDPDTEWTTVTARTSSGRLAKRLVTSPGGSTMAVKVNVPSEMKIKVVQDLPMKDCSVRISPLSMAEVRERLKAIDTSTEEKESSKKTSDGDSTDIDPDDDTDNEEPSTPPSKQSTEIPLSDPTAVPPQKQQHEPIDSSVGTDMSKVDSDADTDVEEDKVESSPASEFAVPIEKFEADIQANLANFVRVTSPEALDGASARRIHSMHPYLRQNQPVKVILSYFYFVQFSSEEPATSYLAQIRSAEQPDAEATFYCPTCPFLTPSGRAEHESKCKSDENRDLNRLAKLCMGSFVNMQDAKPRTALVVRRDRPINLTEVAALAVDSPHIQAIKFSGTFVVEMRTKELALGLVRALGGSTSHGLGPEGALSAGLLTTSSGFKNFNLPHLPSPGPAQAPSKARAKLAQHLLENELRKLERDKEGERTTQRCLLILGQVVKQVGKVNQGKNIPFFRRMLGHKCSDIIFGSLAGEAKGSKQALVGDFEAYAIAVFKREEDVRNALQDCQFHSALGYHLNINCLGVFLSAFNSSKRDRSSLMMTKSQKAKQARISTEDSKPKVDVEARLEAEFGGSKRTVVHITPSQTASTGQETKTLPCTASGEKAVENEPSLVPEGEHLLCRKASGKISITVEAEGTERTDEREKRARETQTQSKIGTNQNVPKPEVRTENMGPERSIGRSCEDTSIDRATAVATLPLEKLKTKTQLISPRETLDNHKSEQMISCDKVLQAKEMAAEEKLQEGAQKVVGSSPEAVANEKTVASNLMPVRTVLQQQSIGQSSTVLHIQQQQHNSQQPQQQGENKTNNKMMPYNQQQQPQQLMHSQQAWRQNARMQQPHQQCHNSFNSYQPHQNKSHPQQHQYIAFQQPGVSGSSSDPRYHMGGYSTPPPALPRQLLQHHYSHSAKPNSHLSGMMSSQQHTNFGMRQQSAISPSREKTPEGQQIAQNSMKMCSFCDKSAISLVKYTPQYRHDFSLFGDMIRKAKSAMTALQGQPPPHVLEEIYFCPVCHALARDHSNKIKEISRLTAAMKDIEGKETAAKESEKEVKKMLMDSDKKYFKLVNDNLELVKSSKALEKLLQEKVPMPPKEPRRSIAATQTIKESAGITAETQTECSQAKNTVPSYLPALTVKLSTLDEKLLSPQDLSLFKSPKRRRISVQQDSDEMTQKKVDESEQRLHRLHRDEMENLKKATESKEAELLGNHTKAVNELNQRLKELRDKLLTAESVSEKLKSQTNSREEEHKIELLDLKRKLRGSEITQAKVANQLTSQQKLNESLTTDLKVSKDNEVKIGLELKGKVREYEGQIKKSHEMVSVLKSEEKELKAKLEKANASLQLLQADFEKNQGSVAQVEALQAKLCVSEEKKAALEKQIKEQNGKLAGVEEEKAKVIAESERKLKTHSSIKQYALSAQKTMLAQLQASKKTQAELEEELEKARSAISSGKPYISSTGVPINGLNIGSLFNGDTSRAELAEKLRQKEDEVKKQRDKNMHIIQERVEITKKLHEVFNGKLAAEAKAKAKEEENIMLKQEMEQVDVTRSSGTGERELRIQLKTVEEALKAAQSNLFAMKSEKETLKENLSKAEKLIVKNQLPSAAMASNLAKAKESEDQAKTMVSSLHQEISSLMVETTNLKSNLEEALNKEHKLSERNEQLKALNQSLETQLELQKSCYEPQLEKVNNQVKQEAFDKEAAERKAAERKAEVQKLKKQMESLISQGEQQNKAVAELDGKFCKANDNIIKFLGIYAEMLEEFKPINLGEGSVGKAVVTKVKMVLGDKPKLKSLGVEQVLDLVKELAEFSTTQLQSYQDSIGELSQKLAEASDKKANENEMNKAALEAKIGRANVEIQSLKAEKNMLATKLESLEATRKDQSTIYDKERNSLEESLKKEVEEKLQLKTEVRKLLEVQKKHEAAVAEFEKSKAEDAVKGAETKEKVDQEVEKLKSQLTLVIADHKKVVAEMSKNLEAYSEKATSLKKEVNSLKSKLEEKESKVLEEGNETVAKLKHRTEFLDKKVSELEKERRDAEECIGEPLDLLKHLSELKDLRYKDERGFEDGLTMKAEFEEMKDRLETAEAKSKEAERHASDSLKTIKQVTEASQAADKKLADLKAENERLKEKSVSTKGIADPDVEEELAKAKQRIVELETAVKVMMQMQSSCGVGPPSVPSQTPPAPLPIQTPPGPSSRPGSRPTSRPGSVTAADQERVCHSKSPLRRDSVEEIPLKRRRTPPKTIESSPHLVNLLSANSNNIVLERANSTAPVSEATAAVPMTSPSGGGRPNNNPQQGPADQRQRQQEHINKLKQQKERLAQKTTLPQQSPCGALAGQPGPSGERGIEEIRQLSEQIKNKEQEKRRLQMLKHNQQEQAIHEHRLRAAHLSQQQPGHSGLPPVPAQRASGHISTPGMMTKAPGGAKALIANMTVRGVPISDEDKTIMEDIYEGLKLAIDEYWQNPSELSREELDTIYDTLYNNVTQIQPRFLKKPHLVQRILDMIFRQELGVPPPKNSVEPEPAPVAAEARAAPQPNAAVANDATVIAAQEQLRQQQQMYMLQQQRSQPHMLQHPRPANQRVMEPRNRQQLLLQHHRLQQIAAAQQHLRQQGQQRGQHPPR